LPDHLYNWTVNYLSDRQHQTKLGDSVSPTLSINASIIHGSALGPVEYVFTASDLHPASSSIHLCKYADDTYLLVPASNSSSIPLEIQHIPDWATANNLKLNNTKSQEMIVHLPRKRKHFPNPIAIHGIERVDKMNILGITVSHTLTFYQHIAVLVTKSARSFYALKTIRTNGHNGNALWDVTRATLVSQLLYASPAWWGYLKFKADERNRLQPITVKAIRYGYLPHSYSTLDELREDSDDKLFFSTRHNPNHVLRRLLPQPKTTEHNLRQRTHNLTLPMDVNATMKQNFVNRMLFRDTY